MIKNLLCVFMLMLSFNANAKTNYTNLTLENGLQAYLIEDHRQPIAVHMMWYKAGSADEVAGKSGLAHLLEHLMFKGTDKIAPQDFSKIIAKLGGIDNASTSFDYTNYFQMINTKNLSKAMSMEADRMENLKFSEEDFQTERSVVIQERKQRIDNSPWGRFYEKVMAALYEEMPYKTITTGTLEDLDNLTRKDSIDWYNTYYAPNNAILLVVGDLTPEKFKELVEKNYSRLKPQEINHDKWNIEPKFEEPKKLVVNDKQVKSPTYYKIFRTPSFFKGIAGEEVNKNDIYNLIVLKELLGGSNTSYLYEKLVLNQELANSISADYTPIGRNESTFDFYLQVKDGVSISKMEKALNFTIDEFTNNFNDQEKLDIAKTKITASQIYARDDAMAFARMMGKFLSAGGKIEDYDDLFIKLDEVSIESIKSTAKKFLSSDQVLDAWLLPESKDVEKK
mgnify:CR=1 FL=1